MCFILLSPPCVSALITAKKELANKKLFITMLVFQFISAYIVAFMVNFIGILFNSHNALIFCAIIVIILAVIKLKSKIKVKINVTKPKNNV